ncbi:TfoX/Sxy family protein [Noviherbaspirillum sp.]|uniref:TfoX/Sxy family protein n=1 Tax=Noviherbaspirillum sp. TaxID=1926288 RepID=UPI002D2B33F6|nr:TfoX/Sxy family protein [Noviherbaspirillum sp.]HZW23799.1 TfoX/Sxy family protein [Noviherbaspirillum sp.]
MRAQHLSDLRNLGPKSAEMLAAAGIRTPDALAERGALDAFIALKQAGLPASLNLLWALEGALSDRDWRTVARDDKLRLLTELEARGVRI